MNSHEDLKSMLYVKLVENMNCPLCHDTLNDSRDLSCGHTYCLACLQELVAINGWTSNIECCLCQERTRVPCGGLNGLKQNCIIDEQAAIMKKLKIVQACTTPSQHRGTTGATETLQVRDPGGKSWSIQVPLSNTTDALRRQVKESTGVPPHLQRLSYEGRVLEGNRKLEDYMNRAKFSTIGLHLDLKGD